MHRLLRASFGAFPTGVLAAVIGISVAFLPLVIEKLLSRRSAKPIEVVASTDTLTEAPDGHVCRPADARSTRFVADLRIIAGSTGSAWRDTRAELQIPHTDSTTVALVADEKLCRGALSAFNTTLGGEWPARPPRSVYLAKVGDTYVAMVPGPPDGSVLVHTVVSSNFEVLSKFAK